MSPGPRRVILLGATGSIGRQAADVVTHLNALHDVGRWPVRTQVVGLAAGARGRDLADLARRLGCANLALADHAAPCDTPPGATLRRGPDAALRLVEETDADLVLAAMVGVAGLPATLAAIERGRDVALANKETLVAAGALMTAAAARTGARLLPVDSEHAGLWQCLGAAQAPPLTAPPTVVRVLLTASGGPFRTWTADQIARATPQEALRHPTWSMGPKVTIDSASLMNKALELLEAHWLFGLPAGRLGVLVHPQSIVHAIVEHADGSAIAQLGAPDMRCPIQHALTWPARAPAAHRTLNWAELSRLDFEPADPARFPAVALAARAIDAGGTAGAVLNAANELAVDAFLAGRIPFPRVAQCAARALDALPPARADRLDAVLDADARAREWARAFLGSA